MKVINVDKDFIIELKYSNFLEYLKCNFPLLELKYIKTFGTDISVHFEITINDNNNYYIEGIIKKIYSFN